MSYLTTAHGSKGEKELQILELRALKGQLEQDIAHFDNIRSANVILDIPPQRPFGGGPQQKPKASVILTLRAGARISAQELRAITYHIAGAVRGITPNMVAISDTTGKLYQAIDPDADYDITRTSEITLEENLKSKIDSMLAKIAGYDHFVSNVQVMVNRDKVTQERKIYSGTVDGVNLGQPVLTSVTDSSQEQMKETTKAKNWLLGKGASPYSESEENRGQLIKQLAVPMDLIKIVSSPGKVESVSVAVLIDKNYFANGSPQNLDSLKANIENQLATILKGYGGKVNQSVEFVPFDTRKPLPSVVESVEIRAPGEGKQRLALDVFRASLLRCCSRVLAAFQKTPSG